MKMFSLPGRKSGSRGGGGSHPNTDDGLGPICIQRSQFNLPLYRPNQELLAFLAGHDANDTSKLLASIFKCGEVNLRVMQLLDESHTSRSAMQADSQTAASPDVWERGRMDDKAHSLAGGQDRQAHGQIARQAGRQTDNFSTQSSRLPALWLWHVKVWRPRADGGEHGARGGKGAAGDGARHVRLGGGAAADGGHRRERVHARRDVAWPQLPGAQEVQAPRGWVITGMRIL
jgi:hypothetical protein